MSSIAPDDALLTVGLRGEVCFLLRKMVLTPKNKLDLMMAPKFWGSVILSQRMYNPSEYLSAASDTSEVSWEHFMITF